MIQEILLDCRELEAPEPFELVMKALNKVDDKTYIKMIHRMKPQMMLDVLKNNGFIYDIDEIDGEFFIIIKKQ